MAEAPLLMEGVLRRVSGHPAAPRNEPNEARDLPQVSPSECRRLLKISPRDCFL